MSFLDSIFKPNTVFGKVGRAAVNTVAAPVNLVIDVAQGKNVLNSIGNRTLQSTGGGGAGIVTNMLITTDLGKKVTSSLSPYTLGLTDRLQGAADVGVKSSQGVELSNKELTLAARDNIILAAAAAGGAYAAGSAGGITATKVGLVATGSKIISGKGSASDFSTIVGASGFDFGSEFSEYLDPLSDLGKAFKDGASRPTPSSAFQGSYDPVGASDGNFSPPPNTNNTVAIVAVVAAVGIAAFLARGKRRA
jgi:hypothetical protein